MRENIKVIFELLRVKQWVKNSFIFFPIIFSGNLFDTRLLTNCLITFFGFCLVSSGLYIFNDYRDRHKDRLHPRKSQRPLARFEISPPAITGMILAFIGVGLCICYLANPLVLTTAIVYILIHLTYNYFAKEIVIIDVIFIALGFQVRIWGGALATQVIPSVWLQMCVFLLALFLGFTKRRHELALLGETARGHRNVLSHYTINLLDQMILICSTLAIVFYGLYTIAPEITARINGHNMVYSIVFVIYGMFRYLYLSHVKKQGDDPGEVLASDPSLLIDVLLWILFICFLLYNPLP